MCRRRKVKKTWRSQRTSVLPKQLFGISDRPCVFFAMWSSRPPRTAIPVSLLGFSGRRLDRSRLCSACLSDVGRAGWWMIT